MFETNISVNHRHFIGMSKPDRNLPALVQRSGESKRSFLNRVHLATDEFIKEVKTSNLIFFFRTLASLD